MLPALITLFMLTVVSVPTFLCFGKMNPLRCTFEPIPAERPHVPSLGIDQEEAGISG